MRRHVNVRLLFALVGATALLGLGTYLLHGIQVRRSSTALLRQAERAEAAGDLDKAEDYLSRYLTFQPASVDGLTRYGRLLERQGENEVARAQAIPIYEQRCRRDPSNRSLRRHVVDLAVAEPVSLFSDALSHVEILLVGASEADVGLLTYLRGRCKEAAGQYDGAVADYRAAIKADAKLVDAYTHLAGLLRERMTDRTRSEQVMADMIGANERSARAYLMRGLYRERYKLPGFEADTARALELDPDDPDVILTAARAAVAKNAPTPEDWSRAIALVRRGVGKYPRHENMYLAFADFSLRAGRPEAAVSALRDGVKALPTLVSLKWALVDAILNSGGTVDPALMAELKAKRVKPELLDYLEGRMALAAGHLAEAAAALESAQAGLSLGSSTVGMAKRSLLLLGHCYERLGNADQRYMAFNRATSLELNPDPFWIPAHMGRAAALIGWNRIDEAIQEYELVLGRPNGSVARGALARLQIYANLQLPPSERRWQQIEANLDAMEKANPGLSQVAILRAETLVAQGKLTPARAVLESALATKPEDVDLWVALANLTLEEQNPDAALLTLDNARKRVGDRVELRVARVEHWIRRGGPNAVTALAAIENDLQSLDPKDRPRLLRELAVGYARLGDDRQAAQIWKRLAAEQPDDLGLQLSLFDLALRGNDEAAAEKLIGQMRRIEGDKNGALWRYGKALLLARQGRKTPSDPKPLLEARSLLLQVATLRPAWSRVPLALAELDEATGNTTDAIKHYLHAIVGLGERSPSGVRKAIRLLTEKNRSAEANLIVKKLEKEGRPISGELQQLAAEVAYQNRDFGHALELGEKAVSATSGDYRDLLWLGKLRATAGIPAETVFRRATAVAGAEPETWIGLVAYLVGTGEKEKAAIVVGEAERALPKAKAPLTLARCYALVGRTDRALDLYRQALAAQPDDMATLEHAAEFHLNGDRVAEADPLLERLAEKYPGTPEGAWARRARALLLASTKGHAGSVQALQLLGGSDVVGGGGAAQPEESPADLRARANVLALQPVRARRRQAMATLEDLIRRDPGQAGDLYLLAQLCEADGDWAKSRRLMLQLLDSQAKSPAYASFLAAYTRALVRHHRNDEARLYLGKLEQAAPGRPDTIEVKARVLHAQGATTEAVSVLKQFVGDSDSRALLAARLLEEFKEIGEAEAMYRASAARSKLPSAPLALAAFLGRQRRTSEALEVCDRAWPTCPPEEVAGTCLAILYNARRDSEAERAVERKLEAAIREHPDSVSLSFDLANLRILQLRYKDAEAIFKEVAERHKSSSSPLNNLAWLLTLSGGDVVQARRYIDRAIQLGGETPDLLDTRALVQMKAGQAEPAVKDLENAIAVNPSPERSFHLARAYQMAGRRSDAADALRDAQSKGLTSESLHPLERKSFESLH